MVLPASLATGNRHDFTSARSTKIEHVPHSPAPQPSLVPVMFRSSRRKSSARCDGLICLTTLRPFTVASIERSAMRDLLCNCADVLMCVCFLHCLRQRPNKKSGRDLLAVFLP